MTYSYNGLSNNPEQMQMYYDNMQTQKKDSSLLYATGGGIVGAGAGAFIAAKKNPCVTKNGELTDTFTKKTYEKFINKNDAEAKEINKQTKNILKEINKIKNTDDLKKLLEKNNKAAKHFLDDTGKTLTEYISGITEDNLSTNKKTIQKSMESLKQSRMLPLKNLIQSCWNPDKKKFEKNSAVSDDLFNIIKSTKNGMKTKLIGKYLFIAGAAGAGTAYAAKKFLELKKEMPQE